LIRLLFKEGLLLEGFEIEALTADWHVHFSSTYKLNLVADGCAQGEAGWMAANFANSLKLLHFLALRYQVKHIVEWFPERCATKY